MLEIDLSPGYESSQQKSEPASSTANTGNQLFNQPPNNTQQPKQKSMGMPQPQQSSRNKLILTIVLGGLIIFLLYLVISGIRTSIGTKQTVGTKQVQLSEEGLKTETPVSNEETDWEVLTDVTSTSDAISPEELKQYKKIPLEELVMENKSLKSRIANLEKQVAENQEKLQEEKTPQVAGLPPSVTALTEFKKGAPSVLNQTSTRQYKDLVPYKKQYVQLPSSDYMFSLLVNYGGQAYNIPVSYADYIRMKEEGVMSVIVEVTEIKTEEETKETKITYLAIDPKWENNISPN